MYLFVVILIFPRVIFGNEIKECLPCNCSVNYWDKLTNAECSSLVGLTGLTEIPETVPSNINGFNFLGQSFTILKNDSFSRFYNLTDIYFPRNKIEIIEQNTFKNLTKLATISLAENNIKYLPDGVFSDLQQLTKIYLSSNKIRVLPKNLFSNLPNLKFVIINSNEIIAVENGCFSNVPGLAEVNLSQNKIRTMEHKIIDDIDKLKYFQLYSNPWNCTEHLCPIIDSVNIESFELTYCKTPSNLDGKPWMDLLEMFPPRISSIQNVIEGETANIKCRCCFASKVIWQLPSPLRSHTIEVSVVSMTSSLVLENVTQKDTGYYRCQVQGCSTCTVGTFLNVQNGIDRDSMASVSLSLQPTSTENINNKDTKNTNSSSFLMAALLVPTIMVIIIGLYVFYHKRVRQIFCRKKQQNETEQELSILHGDVSEIVQRHNHTQNN